MPKNYKHIAMDERELIAKMHWEGKDLRILVLHFEIGCGPSGYKQHRDIVPTSYFSI
jgi:hypothetical protein